MNQILAAPRHRHNVGTTVLRCSHPTHWLICAQVTFPTEGLDLSPFASEDRRSVPAVYDLFATTDHLGASGAAGHYVAHRKDPSGWRTFDDTTHAPTAAERLQGGAAYVLWYRRRDGGAPPAKT